MSDDIVERLRKHHGRLVNRHGLPSDFSQAADEIERLRAELTEVYELREAQTEREAS